MKVSAILLLLVHWSSENCRPPSGVLYVFQIYPMFTMCAAWQAAAYTRLPALSCSTWLTSRPAARGGGGLARCPLMAFLGSLWSLNWGNFIKYRQISIPETEILRLNFSITFHRYVCTVLFVWSYCCWVAVDLVQYCSVHQMWMSEIIHVVPA